jgi:hypothetical protein
MSLKRFVYYSAVAGGWAAFLAWLLAELLFLHHTADPSILQTAAVGGMVGAAVGAAFSLVAGMTNAQWRQELKRLAFGFFGGGVASALGALIGAALYAVPSLHVPRALGWMIMGLGVGAAEGLYDSSSRKIRNGLIGGALGGLIGGVLFDVVARFSSSMSSRATGFVILGISVGALIGLAHVVLKEAWLTVLDGFRPGRQLILAQDVTMLGRGDHLPLPFLGHGDRELESEHLRVARRPDGRFVLEDNHSRIGTQLNSRPVTAAVVLNDGDVIKLGTNIVRFNQRARGARGGDQPRPDAALAGSGRLTAPPPPGTSAVPAGSPPPLPPSREPPVRQGPPAAVPGIPASAPSTRATIPWRRPASAPKPQTPSAGPAPLPSTPEPPSQGPRLPPPPPLEGMS